MFGDDDIEDQQPEAVGAPDAEEAEGNQEITLSDSWVVINSYFASNNLVSQQLESFNHFCKIKLQVRQRPGCTVSCMPPCLSAASIRCCASAVTRSLHVLLCLLGMLSAQLLACLACLLASCSASPPPSKEHRCSVFKEITQHRTSP